MAPEAAIRSALAAWALPGTPELEPLAGGMSSRTWHVRAGGERFVAKLAWDAGTFVAGLAVAEYLERRGLRAGGPVRTRTGELSTQVDGQPLGLLRFVDGAPVDATQPDGLRVWGETLGRAHSLLREIPHLPTGLRRWPWAWLDPAAEHLKSLEWARSALSQALAEAHELPLDGPLTLGVLHGDGAPTLIDSAGALAIIDWGAAMWGPLLYDVGSARWFFEVAADRPADAFEPFLRGYLSSGPLSPAELDKVEAFVRLRCAVQAFYFSWRIANDVGVGLRDPSENARRLEDARRAWQKFS
jgi:homoserine kinase type II